MAHFPKPSLPALSTFTAFSGRRRPLAATLLLSLSAGALGAGVPAAHADDLGDQRSKVRREISAAKAALADTSASSVRAHEQLTAAQTQLTGAQQSLASSQAQLVQAKAADVALQAQLASAQAQVEQATAELAKQREVVTAQRDEIGRQAAASLQHASPQLVGLATMIEAKDPATLPTGAQAVSNLMTRQNTLLERMKTLRAQLRDKEEALSKARDDVAAKKQAAADNVVRMASLEQQAQSAQASVAALVSRRTTAQQAADQAKASDESELGALNAEDARISAMLVKRAAEAKAAAARAAAKARASGRAATSSESGESNGSGPLERPVPGYVTSPFGYRVHPIYGYYSLHNGTDFHAPCGTPMKAAGNGRVIEKYYQTAWGNRLLIDLGQVRGHNVVVIYNHAPGYRVGVGDRVTRGEVIGYSGTTGWSTGCHLHFTVMVDGVPKNPMDWVS